MIITWKRKRKNAYFGKCEWCKKKVGLEKNGENMKGEQNFKKSNEIINKILKKWRKKI